MSGYIFNPRVSGQHERSLKSGFIYFNVCCLVFFCSLLGALIVPTFGFCAAVSVHRGPVFADPLARRSHAGTEEVVLVVSRRRGAQTREVRLRSGRVRR